MDGVVEKIVVTTKDNNHSLDTFKTNYVGDELVWNEMGKPVKGYTLKEGRNDIDVELMSKDKRLKKTVRNGQ